MPATAAPEPSHDSTEKVPSTVAPSSKPSFSCPVTTCQFSSPSLNVLTFHLVNSVAPLHDNLRLCTCPVCGSRLFLEAFLAHIQDGRRRSTHSQLTDQDIYRAVCLGQRASVTTKPVTAPAPLHTVSAPATRGSVPSSATAPSPLSPPPFASNTFSPTTANFPFPKHPDRRPSEPHPTLPSPAASDEGFTGVRQNNPTPVSTQNLPHNGPHPQHGRKRSSGVAFADQPSGTVTPPQNTFHGPVIMPYGAPPGYHHTLVDKWKHQMSSYCFMTGSTAVDSLSQTWYNLGLEACKTTDLFFLVLLQVMLLHLVQRPSLPSCITNVAGYNESLVAIHSMLNPGNLINQRFAFHWSTFPCSLAFLESSSRTGLYADPFRQLVQCLECFARTNTEMRSLCASRKFPPAVDELRAYMKIPSPLLQRIVFTCTIPAVWPTLHPVSNQQLEHIFARDQQQPRSALDASQIALASPSWNETVIQEYMGLHRANAVALGQDPDPSILSRPHSANLASRQTTASARRPAQAASPVIQSPGAQWPHGPPAQARPQSSHVQQPQWNLQSANMRSASASSGPVQSPNQPNGNTSRTNRNLQGSKDMSQQLLFPRKGIMGAQVAPPEPMRYALHQAHLRSPRLRCATSAAASTANERMYQQVQNFLRGPEMIKSWTPVQEWKFHISADVIRSKAYDTASTKSGEPPTRHCSSQHKSYRLRCVKINKVVDLPQWVTLETYWPENLFFEFNGVRLDPRLKLHYGRCLPIDVTPHIRENENVLKVFALTSAKSATIPEFAFAFAIEQVSLSSHSDIVSTVKQRNISKSTTLNSIRQVLTSSDDDIACLSTTLPIKLTDPISGLDTCKVPVRGNTCKHREAFDLETFLSSRPSKAPDEPCVVDCWQCPICKGDARPDVLCVDEFLLQVIAELQKQVGGGGGSTVIDVDVDGKWTARRDRDESAGSGRRAEAQPLKKATPVIDLDGTNDDA